SLGPAIFVGGWAIQQLWLFWVAPILGAVIGGYFYNAVLNVEEAKVKDEEFMSKV
ncbi:MAG: aquaporin, partial [Nostocaceae cyanobacterium]|nr:aquaporin [Nostocaceae cyanobacterium]